MLENILTYLFAGIGLGCLIRTVYDTVSLYLKK